MATKKKGGPKLTSINGGRKAKAKPSAPEVPLDMIPPPALMNTRVTQSSLTKGSYQRKLMAWAAPILMPELFSAIRRTLKTNDAQAMKLTSEIFGLTGKSGGISINVNQTNNNKAEAASLARSAGPTSVDDMLRQLAAEREARALAGPASRPAIEVTATPSGYGKGDEA